MGLEIGDVIGDLHTVAIGGKPTGFVEEPNSDFGSGEFGPLGSVSVEDRLMRPWSA